VATINAGITPQPLDIPAAIAAVADPDCGGIGLFVGTVRVSAAVAANRDKSVTGLDYEAHPMLAPERLQALLEEAAAKWDLRHVVAKHRTGACELGEPTVVVACSAPHRGDALDACHWIIDGIKSTVPIWKRELYADGSDWVGAENDT
jgi:molybdopterin synthase catalytic subunit